jgi:hypothetical protein
MKPSQLAFFMLIRVFANDDDVVHDDDVTVAKIRPDSHLQKRKAPLLISSHLHPLIRGRVAGGAAQAGGPRLPFPGPY